MKNLKLKLKIKNLCFLVFVLTVLLFNLPIGAIAAELYIESSQMEYRPGDTFIANIKIDTQGECINTVKADVKFSNDYLEAVDFTQSDSILVFWVENPSIKQNQGLISFAGGIPGGYCEKGGTDSGSNNLIGKMIFKVKEENLEAAKNKLAEIKFLGTSEVLLNDGAGTEANLVVRNADFKITADSGPAEDEWQKEKINDKIPPEPFTIEIHEDQEIFEGNYFVIFSTLDKQTGLDRYEVKEGSGQWTKAESPYLLKDQSLKSAIEVKAIDKAGNERLAESNHQNPGYKSQAKSVSGSLDILWILVLVGVWMAIRFVAKKLKTAKNQNEKS